MSSIIITNENFEDEVIKSDGTVLLDFWAEWCGPCRMLSPTVEEISDEVASIKVGKVNVDKQSQLAAKFNIRSIPTLVVIKDGKVIRSESGVKSKQAILQMLDV